VIASRPHRRAAFQELCLFDRGACQARMTQIARAIQHGYRHSRVANRQGPKVGQTLKAPEFAFTGLTDQSTGSQNRYAHATPKPTPLPQVQAYARAILKLSGSTFKQPMHDFQRGLLNVSFVQEHDEQRSSRSRQ
jgi:hypothetical protein